MPTQEQKAAYARAYYARNREKIMASQKPYVEKNREKIRTYQRAWRKANYKKKAAYDTAWHKANPEKVSAAGKRWRYKNIEVRRAAERISTWKSYLRKLGIDPNTLPPKAEMCELCGSRLRIGLDHCHATKQFRGWLCRTCNLGLGHFKDDPMVLEKAAGYLRNHHGR